MRFSKLATPAHHLVSYDASVVDLCPKIWTISGLRNRPKVPWTCPPKIWTILQLRKQPKVRSSRHEEDRHEEAPVYGPADRPGPAPGGAGHRGGRTLPQARRERDDVLPLEEAVRRHGGGRAAAGQAARGGESTAEAGRRRSHA